MTSRRQAGLSSGRHVGAHKGETMIYIPPPERPSFWPFIFEAAVFAAFEASIIALAVLARAILGN